MQFAIRYSKEEIERRRAYKALLLERYPDNNEIRAAIEMLDSEDHIVEAETPEEFEIRYRDYILSEQWQLKADAAKQKAGYRCQVCYGTNKIQAHHRTYIRLGNEHPSDITVLCDDCHSLFKTHGKLKDEQALDQ